MADDAKTDATPDPPAQPPPAATGFTVTIAVAADGTCSATVDGKLASDGQLIPVAWAQSKQAAIAHAEAQGIPLGF